MNADTAINIIINKAFLQTLQRYTWIWHLCVFIMQCPSVCTGLGIEHWANWALVTRAEWQLGYRDMCTLGREAYTGRNTLLASKHFSFVWFTLRGIMQREIHIPLKASSFWYFGLQTRHRYFPQIYKKIDFWPESTHFPEHFASRLDKIGPIIRKLWHKLQTGWTRFLRSFWLASLPENKKNQL